MFRFITFLLTCVTFLTSASAAICQETAPNVREVTVFESGKGGYRSFRIPAVIAGAKGTLLAFAEGRVDGAGDSGNIDVVLKRSTDGGKTWGQMQVVLDEGQTLPGTLAQCLTGQPVASGCR